MHSSTYNTTETQFLYDGNKLIAEYNSSGTLLRRYVHGVGTDDPLVQYNGSGTGNKVYLLADERGSIIAELGNSQIINKYGPYGEPMNTNGSRFRYTGQILLPGTELYHYKARVYHPKLGRFMQTDPIGYKDGMNWYAYVGNDPVNLVDPLGLCHKLRSGRTIGCDGLKFFFVADTNGGGGAGPREKVTLDDTTDALNHYFNGNGEPAALSKAVKEKIMNHPHILDQVSRNINGNGRPPNRIDIDFTGDGWDVFHLGDTKVIYTETCSNGNCSINFTAPIYDRSGAPDRFQDPTGLGFEMPGGVPYEYETFDWSVTYPEP